MLVKLAQAKVDQEIRDKALDKRERELGDADTLLKEQNELTTFWKNKYKTLLENTPLSSDELSAEYPNQLPATSI